MDYKWIWCSNVKCLSWSQISWEPAIQTAPASTVIEVLLRESYETIGQKWIFRVWADWAEIMDTPSMCRTEAANLVIHNCAKNLYCIINSYESLWLQRFCQGFQFSISTRFKATSFPFPLNLPWWETWDCFCCPTLSTERFRTLDLSKHDSKFSPVTSLSLLPSFLHWDE